MNELLIKAIGFAMEKHGNQKRKLGGSPYLIHPLEAVTIAATMTNDEEILAAAALHDTVEDTNTSIETIKAEFGERVAKLVSSETENKYRGIPACETWKQRKTESLELLKNADDEGTGIMWLSDKLSNMRSFYRNYVKEGDALWQHFNNKNPEDHKWYYSSVAEILKPKLSDYPAWREYSHLVNLIFKTEIGK